MPETVYKNLVRSVDDYVQSDIIIDIAVGQKCIGVRTRHGIGLTYVTGEAWERASQIGPESAETSCRGAPLSGIVPRYLEDDPLYTAIALAALNSLHIEKGEDDPRDWFRDLGRKRRLGMVGYFCPIMDRIALSLIEPVIFELRDIPGTYGPERAPELLPTCDAVLITGATFANKTVHHYLPHIAPDADACIFGHSTPLADFLLERFTLGATRIPRDGSPISNADEAFRLIRRGGNIRELKPFTRKVIRRTKT